MPKTLRWRLIFAIVPVVIAGIVVVVGAQYYLSRSQILAGINQEIQNRAERTAAAIDSLLRQRRNDLLTLSDSPLISDYHHNEDYGLKAEAESYRRELESYLLQFARRSAVCEAIFSRMLAAAPSAASSMKKPCLPERRCARLFFSSRRAVCRPAPHGYPGRSDCKTGATSSISRRRCATRRGISRACSRWLTT